MLPHQCETSCSMHLGIRLRFKFNTFLRSSVASSLTALDEYLFIYQSLSPLLVTFSESDQTESYLPRLRTH